MKHFCAIILALCATASAQIIKTLGYNTTNGEVVFSWTNLSGASTLTFTNDDGISANAGSFGNNVIANSNGITFYTTNAGFAFSAGATAAQFRDDLGLGSADSVSFRNISADANIVISNQSSTNSGLLFIYRTNNEPFLGLANLIASNNTAISNETLFRVGVAEATNKSAQFGFRATNTNGTGVAVFSVFGYNALAMVGPSSRSITNTNGIEADIYSISPTNKVATLIDTNTGATLMHRPVGFTTNASAPANTTNVVGWIEFYVGTNSVRVPYYQ